MENGGKCAPARKRVNVEDERDDCDEVGVVLEAVEAVEKGVDVENGLECVARNCGVKGVAELLVEREFHMVLLRMLDECVGERVVECLRGMLEASRAVHDKVLDVEFESGDNVVGVIKWLGMIARECSDVERVRVLLVVYAIVAFSLSDSEACQVVRLINESLDCECAESVRWCAKVMSRLAARKTGIPEGAASLEREVVVKFVRYLGMESAPVAELCTVLGSLVGFIASHNVALDLVKIANFAESDDVDVVLTSAWCVTNFVLCDRRFLTGFDLPKYVLRLYRIFPSLVTDNKISLAYPIVMLCQFLDSASLQELFRQGILSIFGEIVSFKSVLVLESLLDLILQSVERDPSILHLESMPDFLESLSALESQSDYAELSSTLIPSAIAKLHSNCLN